MKAFSVIAFVFLLLSLQVGAAPAHKVVEIRNANKAQTLGFGVDQNLASHRDPQNKYCGWINASLVHGDGSPVGTMIDKGWSLTGGSKKWEEKLVNLAWSSPEEPRNIGNFSLENGIIGLKKNGEFFLVSYSEGSLVDPTEVNWAMQNGPILLRNGNNPHKADSKSKFFRTGMGYSSDGKLFLIATQEATNLYTFAQIFKRYGVQNAMSLDGFPRYQKYIGIKGVS